MRSCPKIQVFLEPVALYGGSQGKVRVALVSASETPVSRITVSLVGKERRYHRTRSSGSTSSKVYHRRTIVHLVATYPARTLGLGHLDLIADFQLPTDAPPSYESQYSKIEYAVVVDVEVPWWFDAHAEFPLTVFANPRQQPGETKPTRFENTFGPDGKKLYIEASLGQAVVPLGGAVEAACSLSNLEFHRVTQVAVDLVVVETPLVKSTTGADVTWTQPGNVLEPIADGASLPIFFGLSPSLPPSFTTPFIQVEHFVRIRAKIRFGFDEELLVPLVVAPQATPTTAAKPALVGSAKQAAVWSLGAQRATALGARVVRVDADRGELALDVDGVPVLVAQRRGKDDKLRLTGSVDYPDLGLGLQLATRAWSDMGQGLSLPGQAARTLFADGREPNQVAAFLESSVVEWLLLFDQVAMSDAEALVSDPGSPHKRRDLTFFVERMIQGARLLLAARARIPAPRGLSVEDVRAYRAFALAIGGELVVGDMSVRGGGERRLVVDLSHDLEATGPARSRWSFRAPGHDLSGVALRPGSGASFVDGAVTVVTPFSRDPRLSYDDLATLRDTLARSLGRELGPYR
jgi:hypothetical protein